MIISPLKCNIRKDFRITQKFGNNSKYYARFGLSGHDGIDFAGRNPGDKVPCYACFDGEIVGIGKSKHGYGNYIKIKTDRNGNGESRELLYAHLDSFSDGLKKGDRVYVGNPIGIIGNTGNSTGVHLHLRVRVFAEDGTIKNYNNGYKGAYDYLPYLLQWTRVQA